MNQNFATVVVISVGVLLLATRIVMAGPTTDTPSPPQETDEIQNTLQSTSAVPYLDPATGQPKCYTVQSPNPSTENKQMGLRQGDFLMEVNGVPVTTPGNALEAFQQLRKEPNAQVKVKRYELSEKNGEISQAPQN